MEKVPEVRLENGWVWTDDHQRTSVPGLFAAGDVTGRMLLAQVAARQGAVAAEGWVEVVADGRYGEILGGHLVGPHAGELVSQVAGMMQAEGTILEWEKVIHPHPTLSEAIGEAVAMAAHQMRAGAGR